MAVAWWVVGHGVFHVSLVRSYHVGLCWFYGYVGLWFDLCLWIWFDLIGVYEFGLI